MNEGTRGTVEDEGTRGTMEDEGTRGKRGLGNESEGKGAREVRRTLVEVILLPAGGVTALLLTLSCVHGCWCWCWVGGRIRVWVWIWRWR